MIDPVISISIGFFVILCLLVKFTGVNDITSDIVDENNDEDDLTNIKSINDIDTSKYDIIQTYYDLDAPIPSVTYFADGSTKELSIEDALEQNTVYMIHKKDNNEQLSQLIEPEPIQENDGIIKETHTQHILDSSSKEKDLIDLSGTTLISLKSIKQ